ncbi:Oidioi.mRNA.OKI2018_I69.chr1.g2091.t1.cds [Oikopleura dioica]|uniref:Oidioi.mRNA.OKI2018_I69.chr1.g2091.t1.cds n=1 Tax=Oikopleura dioica TaxID=34765 RepID=A0ABN7SU74_OIKDI|nr:Oidioi.mRNA.OKI2018_I69.chr1.g2091.t1.cds [Oikopleura dioica]
MNDSISCISPIREEVITCAIPEDALESVDSLPTTTVTPKRRSFASKRSLLTPKSARYASCSNLADLNESDILNTSTTSIQSAASEFKLPKRKRKSLFGSIFRKPITRSASKRRSIEVKIDDDIVIWEEAIPSPKRRRSGILRRLTMSKKSDL